MSQTASSLLLQTTSPSATFPPPSSTNTNNNWGNWPSPTSSNTPNGNGNNNYSNQSIGATPSAVLFFLALAVGVVIALLFIFFTIRYFIRVKYGVNLSGISRRNFYNYQGRRRQNNIDNNNNNDSDGGGGTNNSVVNEHTFAHIFTTTEVQDQLQYIREHHYLRGEIIDRRLNYGSESLAARRRRQRQRRRRRRGRFAKMKKLTIEEVELLFPQKTYSSWMNGGKQSDIEKRGGMLYEEETEESQAAANLINGNVHVTDERTGNNDRCGDEDDNSSLPTLYTANINTSANIGSSTSNNDIEMKQLTSIVHAEHGEHDETDLADGTTTSAVTSNEKDHALDDQHSLHYDSGSCAICLEVIEDDDIVRGLICGHVFHAECLDPWLTKRRACCPMCKRDYLFKRDYHDPNRTNEESNTNEENSGNSNNMDANNNNDTNTNDNNNNTNNNNENSDEDDDDDSLSLDLEELRNDPALQLMLQELIPPSERVRILLNDSRYADLNLEERGQAIAKKKYGRFFKIIFWKVMGISRADLFHWAVLKLVREYRRDHPEQFPENAETNNNNNNGDNEAANEEGEATAEATTGEASNEGESNQEETSTTTTTPPPTTEVDISESSTRRQIIENRV